MSVVLHRAAWTPEDERQAVSLLDRIQVSAMWTRTVHLLGLEAVLSLFSSGAGDLGLSPASSVFCSEAPFTGVESGKHTFIDRGLLCILL